MSVDLIKVYPNFISSELAEIICDYSRKTDSSFFKYQDIDYFKIQTFSEIANNDVKIIGLLQNIAKKTYNQILEDYEGPFEDFLERKTHISKFDPDAEMPSHFDATRPNDIATLIYLNDNYEGGEIYFPDHDIKIKLKTGDMIAFPDNPSFMHGVKKIVGSNRYALPRWFTRIV
jgi:hypothetical protein